MSSEVDQLMHWLRARDPVTPITTSETHISVLAFQGERVYKVKKAVRLPFADFSTLELRRADCEREVALNRRLAPEVYLGVEDVRAAGAVVDAAVVMVRMPAARRLSQLVTAGAGVAPCLDALAARMAEFHGTAATGGAVDDAASAGAIAQLWGRSFDEYAVDRDVLAPFVARYLAGRERCFADRVRAGRARDGHGDLLADDVFCVDESPRVLDCLEFDDRLRFGDVLADVAFLAMDLERLGRADLARRFLDRYRAITNDAWPPSLEHFYVAYRAHVRAKIAALAGDDERAAQLVYLTRAHLERGRVRLVLVGGSPGSGKTTLATGIARAAGLPVLHSDEVRKELAGLMPGTGAAAALDEGLYGPAWTERTYDMLCSRAEELLGSGASVIIDASWSDARWRARAGDVAAATASDLVALRCDAPAELGAARAAARRAGASDAGPDIARAVAARFAPWPDAHVLDTTVAAADATRAALALIGPI
jgi:aminoglycoside phosphotransferase family enzyme/predicted kinase